MFGPTLLCVNANISALLQACDELSLPYDVLHASGNFVRVTLSSKPRYFVNWSTPFNDQGITRICLDKEFSYALLRDVIAMPKTLGFLSPSVQEAYKSYVHFDSIANIQDEISREFSLPIVVKRNRGSHGSKVFRCSSHEEVGGALGSIFDENDREYDYVALAQECIAIEKEFRVVVYDGRIQLAYEKSLEGAAFTGNLSPLHHENAKALAMTDQEVLAEIQTFIDPLFSVFPLQYGGLDIVRDRAGKWRLLECNSSPSFTRFIRDNGPAEVVKMFRRILGSIQNRSGAAVPETVALGFGSN